jgi:hypothetical protein
MNTPTKPERLTREKAHAIVKRLLADSMETRRQMEAEFHTDPGVKSALARLDRRQEETAENRA